MAPRQPDSHREGTPPTGPPEVLDDRVDAGHEAVAVWSGPAPCTMLEDVLTTAERRAMDLSRSALRPGTVPDTTTHARTAVAAAA